MKKINVILVDDHSLVRDGIKSLLKDSLDIEVIGEAVKLVSENIRNKNPDVPWQKIARTRDMLIHHYFDVDDKELWKIVADDLPALKTSIQKILN